MFRQIRIGGQGRFEACLPAIASELSVFSVHSTFEVALTLIKRHLKVEGSCILPATKGDIWVSPFWLIIH